MVQWVECCPSTLKSLVWNSQVAGLRRGLWVWESYFCLLFSHPWSLFSPLCLIYRLLLVNVTCLHSLFWLCLSCYSLVTGSIQKVPYCWHPSISIVSGKELALPLRCAIYFGVFCANDRSEAVNIVFKHLPVWSFICYLFLIYCGWGYKCLLVLLKTIYISVLYLGFIFYWEVIFIFKLDIISFVTGTRRKRRKRKGRSPCLLITVKFFKWS